MQTTLLYHFQHRWFPNGKNPLQSVFLRPAQSLGADGGRMVGKIIEIHVCALDYYFDLPKADNPFADDEGNDIYFNRLGNNNYYIKDEENIPDSHHLIAHAEIYLKTNFFDQQEFWEWVKTYFVLRGFEWTDLEKGTLTDFPETNTILQMFSVENVQMMEDKLGKDWWKE